MGLRSHFEDPVYANGVALVLNAGLSSLLGFAFWMVAARRFNADALGVGAAVVSAATLAALVGKAGFDAAIVRYAPSSSASGLRRLLLRSAFATVTLTGLVGVSMLVVAKFGVPSLEMLTEPMFAAGFLALALGTALAWVLDAYYISEQRAVLVLLRNVAFNVVKLGVPLFLAFTWGGRAVPLAWGVGLMASLALAFGLLPAALRRHSAHGERPAKSALGYSMRNYALNLSEFLPGLLLPIVVLHALGAEENARFFLAWTMATVLFLASKAVSQSAFAALVRERDASAPLRKALGLSFGLLIPPAAVLYVGAAPLLALFGPHYVAGAALLRILALSIPFVIALNLYLATLKAHDAGWELTILPLASLVALLSAMPFALAVGIEGAGIAWLTIHVIVGTYAALRLVPKLRRITYVEPKLGTPLRHRAHKG